MAVNTAREPQKEKDVGQIIRYLTHTFNQATSKMERPWRNPKTGIKNQLYDMQREFAYRLNEVGQAPRCLLQKAIAECNDYIDVAISTQNK
jgi:hypothetical protein